MDAIVGLAGIPILFQTSRLHRKSSAEKASTYAAVCRGYPHVLAFELGQIFAPNGEIFDEETFRRLTDIPEIKGMKHSSLDRLVELKRLALRDEQRPEFRIYTGNDLGINRIEYARTIFSASPVSLRKSSLNVTACGRPAIRRTMRFQTHCSIWVTLPFAPRFRLTSTLRRCSCIWPGEFRATRSIPGTRRVLPGQLTT